MLVTLRPLARTFVARPGESLLAAALGAGIRLPRSCRGGSCGACRARIVDGVVTYPRGRPAGLTAGEAAAGEALLCQAEAASDLTLEVTVVQSAVAAEIKELPCRIERLERLAPTVVAVYLRLPAIEEFRFRPGQYVDLLLAGGARRSYSIANPPHDATLLELHVRRLVGGEFSSALYSGLREGALLRLEGPFGALDYHEPDDPGLPACLVAGGTGFAPLKSILRHALERGRPRPLTLYFGARAPEDLYADAWLRDCERRHAGFRYHPVLSGPGEGPVRRGLVHEAVLEDLGPRPSAEVYAAGPPAMIEALRAGLGATGVPPARIHSEAFGGAPPRG